MKTKSNQADRETAVVVPRLVRGVRELAKAQAEMAPHQRTRQNGKLILECFELLGTLSISLAHLEKHLSEGAKIVFQDGQWWLFGADGEGIKGRMLFEELIMDMPPNVKLTQP